MLNCALETVGKVRSSSKLTLKSSFDEGFGVGLVNTQGDRAMDFFQRLVAWIIVGIVFLLIVVFVFPILLLFAIGLCLYELSPKRRQQLFDYETAILAFLAKHGESEGRDIRAAANSETGITISLPSFYGLMHRFETEKIVTGRDTEKVIENENERIVLSARIYTLQDPSWRYRRKRGSMRRAVWTLRSRLIPFPS